MAGIAISKLKNKHRGQDIWVIGAGPSAGFVDAEFFANKITVGVNYTWRHFDVDYVVVKENFALWEALKAGQTVAASRFHCGNMKHAENNAEQPFYVFDHVENELDRVNLDVIGTDDRLVVSYSTITSAIHLAAYLGAENIILVGHDCGTIDGQDYMSGYYIPAGMPSSSQEFIDGFIRAIEPQSLAVRERIREVYGCRVYSLNPWINLGLEGHKYES